MASESAASHERTEVAIIQLAIQHEKLKAAACKMQISMKKFKKCDI